MQNFARTAFDGRTKLARSLEFVPSRWSLQIVAEQRIETAPAQRFAVGQVVETPDGDLTVLAAVYSAFRGWRYTFEVVRTVGVTVNGVAAAGGMEFRGRVSFGEAQVSRIDVRPAGNYWSWVSGGCLS